MPVQTLKIDNVLGGDSESQYQGSQSTYNVGLGIDPDFGLSDPDNSGAITTGVRTSGLIMPTRYEKFSSTGVTGYPMWFVTQPKNESVYSYLSSGPLLRYDSDLTNETAIGTPTAGVGNGMIYYNNYIYLATPTNISRYGPLNNSPSLVNTVWTAATLGSQPALINSTYPASGITIPNHPMHVHGDSKLYFGDYNTVANPGKGVIHYIATTKTTDEGDTDNGSTDNKLVLPFNFLPTDIESYGTDLVISAIQGTSTTINQGRAALFFWDTTSATFYRGPIYSQDTLITAMKSVNGELYVWSGNSTRGCRLSKYIGGESLQEVMFIEDSPPPLAGAIDSWGSRIAWGGSTSYPVTRGVVYSYGSKDERLPNGLSVPIISTAGATTPLVTSILNFAHLSFVRPKLLVGWGNGTTYGIDKRSTTATYASQWRSEMFSVNNNFSIERLRLPLSAAVAANMSIVPKIILDNFTTTVTLPTISTTLYSGLNKILYQAAELNALAAQGQDNFIIELNFAGTAEVAVGFPILVNVNETEDENSI